MPRAARNVSPPAATGAPVPQPEQTVRFAVYHPVCAKCGHPASLGMILTDGVGTGPWLCHPSTFLGRPGCRALFRS